MLPGKLTSTAATLAIALVIAGVAWAQDSPADLARRVEALEQALAKAELKAAADRKKAAGRPSVEFGGKMMVDHVFNSQDDLNKQVFGEAKNGVEFRLLRLQALGKAFDVLEYKCELDFSTAGAATKDAYIGVTNLPVLGNARAGQFKEPMGLEELTSYSYTTFMERSMGRDAFLPQRNVGFMFFDWNEDERMTWAAGMFDTDIGDVPAQRIADELAQSFTGRVTWLPWYDECTEGRGLLHTGASYSYRHAFHHQRQFRTGADEHIGPFIVDTGVLEIADYQIAGAEMALVYGPFSIQSEYMLVLTEPAPGIADQRFDAFYVQASYFLTGEHRPYRRRAGVFDRTSPLENFFRVRAEDGCIYTGKGAWEVAYRFDYIDVSQANPAAGLAATQTLGLNWYLSPYSRVMWNYVHAEPHKYYTDAGTIDALLMRFQVDF